jgi:protocatechuate 4,5-dioxygenase, alpha chain
MNTATPSPQHSPPQPIPGTYIFDGRMAMKGYNLNRMCYSFNAAENRRKFKAFPEAYCHAYHLSREQIHAVTDLDVLRMLQLGGNIYYLAKLTGIYGMSVQDLGAQQTGLSLDEFRAMLVSQA